MTYRPTPTNLKRDINLLLYVLAIAHSNLDKMHIPSGEGVEETAAGSCYDTDLKQAK